MTVDSKTVLRPHSLTLRRAGRPGPERRGRGSGRGPGLGGPPAVAQPGEAEEEARAENHLLLPG